MCYKQISLEERHYIEFELKKGIKPKNIAKSLGRNPTTIYREISRNTGLRGYRHKQANNFALARHKEKNKNIKMTDELKQVINGYIESDWSPEQISGYLKKQNEISVHHETIYKYILADKKAGGQLYLHLRHQNKTYRKRYGNARNRTGIPNRTSIDERPAVVNDRSRVGDWEGDTIIGKAHKGAIVTIDERVSKLRLAFPLAAKKAQDVADAIKRLLMPIKDYVLTFTFDNGKEFTAHEQIAKNLECDTYFARPYHSWERGQNENANGLLRQYFPKSMELNNISIKKVFDAVHKLNNRPRKCLGYRTPYEVFEELTGINMNKSKELHL